MQCFGQQTVKINKRSILFHGIRCRVRLIYSSLPSLSQHHTTVTDFGMGFALPSPLSIPTSVRYINSYKLLIPHLSHHPHSSVNIPFISSYLLLLFLTQCLTSAASIYGKAFSSSTSLDILSSMTSIDARAFAYCTSEIGV